MTMMTAARAGLQLDIPAIKDNSSGFSSARSSHEDIEGSIQQRQSTATPLSPSSQENQRRIRFNDLCSLIPEPEEQPQESSKNATLQGRPRLSTRTYSLTLSGLFSHQQEPVPGTSSARHPDEDGFMPNSPPRFSLKLPTLTRRRRSSTSVMHCSKSTRAPLKSCLKSPTEGCYAKTTPVGGNILSPLRPAMRVNTDYFASQGPQKSPDKHRDSAERRPQLISVSSTDLDDNCEKIPLSPCCNECYKGTDYGLLPPTPSDLQNPHGCTDMYFERWSKQARFKREKDKEWAAQCGRHIDEEQFVPELGAANVSPSRRPHSCSLPSITETIDEVDIIRRNRNRTSSPALAEKRPDAAADEESAKILPKESSQALAPLTIQPAITRTQSHTPVAHRRPEAKRTISNSEQRRPSPHKPSLDSSTTHWSKWIAGMSGVAVVH